MKKLLLFLLTTSICTISSGQVTYSLLEARMENWDDAVIADVLPANADKKTVEFPHYNYCISGYFSKGILTEGQLVKIIDTEAGPLPILEGKVSYMADRLVVKGVKYEYEGALCNRIYGTFYVSNSSDNMMTYRPAKAGKIVIKEYSIDFYRGYCLDMPAIISYTGTPYVIAVDGRGTGKGLTEFSAPLRSSSVSRIGYDKPYELLMTTRSDVFIKWRDGTIFRGGAVPGTSEDGNISFTLLAGLKTGSPKGCRTVRVVENGDRITMERIDDPEDEELAKEVVTVADKTKIPPFSYWDESTFYRNMDEIRMEYRNGDTYEGKAEYRNSVLLTGGIYRYANGDYFEGNPSGGIFYGTMICGTTHLKDGTSLTGNWLSEFGLTEIQYARVAQLDDPSSIRNAATICRKDNLYSTYMSAAGTAEKDMDYIEAKRCYLAAKEIKPASENWDEIIGRLDIKIRKVERYDEMMTKYGAVMGYKVAECILETGMTREMAVDAFSADSLLLNSYRATKTDEWYDTFEVWEYDYDSARQYLAGISGDASTGTENLYSELSRKVRYKSLMFRNDILVEIVENSSVENK